MMKVSFRSVVMVGVLLMAMVVMGNPQFVPTNRPIPKALLEEAMARRMRMTGGMIAKPGAQKGRIAFVCAQDKFPQLAVQDIAKQLAALSRFDIVCVAAKSGVAGDEVLKQAQAEVAVILVSDSKTPLMLLAPEEGWAMVNVAKIPSGDKFKAGCCKELLRAFAMLCAGGVSQMPGNVLSEPRLQDTYDLENTLPKDVTFRMAKYLKSRGVTASSMTTYKSACEQGWAPAPTNDIQKAIFERVKADKERGPTNPITIKPPAKK